MTFTELQELIRSQLATQLEATWREQHPGQITPTNVGLDMRIDFLLVNAMARDIAAHLVMVIPAAVDEA